MAKPCTRSRRSRAGNHGEPPWNACTQARNCSRALSRKSRISRDHPLYPRLRSEPAERIVRNPSPSRIGSSLLKPADGRSCRWFEDGAPNSGFAVFAVPAFSPCISSFRSAMRMPVCGTLKHDPVFAGQQNVIEKVLRHLPHNLG